MRSARRCPGRPATRGSSLLRRARTGEQRDASEGLYYLRARYYDPATGRFLGRDPVVAGHPYTYVGNDPVNYLDPTGLHCMPWHPYHCPIPIWDDAWECLTNPFECTYELRAPLTITLEKAFSDSAGDDRIPKEGGITVVENCTGTCAVFLDAVNQDAVTIGHTIFFRGEMDPDLMPHELTHVQQYELFGDWFLPMYLTLGNVSGLVGCLASGFSENCLHNYNLFEAWAD